ncbi:MAG: PAS domain-containing protein, partial [Paucibacter sp.]|nr:PAS domain-containing protein [Roseateles sp.]
MTPIDSLRSAPGLQPGLVRLDADLRLLNDDGTPSTVLSARVHPAARSRLAAYLQAQREQPQAEAWLLGLPLNVEPEQMAWVDVRLHWQAEASGGAGGGAWLGECRDATQALLDQRLAALGLSVLDLMPSAAVITEARADRPIVYANPAFVALTGYDREEILGRSCAFLQGQEREQPALPALRRAVAALTRLA